MHHWYGSLTDTLLIAAALKEQLQTEWTDVKPTKTRSKEIFKILLEF